MTVWAYVGQVWRAVSRVRCFEDALDDYEPTELWLPAGGVVRQLEQSGSWIKIASSVAEHTAGSKQFLTRFPFPILTHSIIASMLAILLSTDPFDRCL